MAMNEYSTFYRTVASVLDGSETYLEHSFEGSYPSAEMQSAYSTVPADWAW